MSIPASNLVNVTPRVINAGGNALEFAGLFITKNPLVPFPGAISFTSDSLVADYFGEASEEYAAAQHYFLGYDNSFRKPRTIYFARSADTALAGALIGGECESVADLKTIADGTFSITIDGTAANVTGLDLSEITTQSDAAQAIQTALTTAGASGATVEYSSQTGGFIITSGTTGDSSTVTVATGTDAEALGLTLSTGAQVSAGTAALTPSGTMESIVKQTQNWATFTTLYKPEADEILGYCEWANAQNVDYLYVPWTTDTADTLTTNTQNLPNQMAEANYEGVALIYGDVTYAAFVMGIAGSIDWNRNNGLVTFKFKSQSGLEPSVTDAGLADALISMHVNYYGRYATRADDFVLLAEGRMIGGNYDFIDTFLGMVWIKNQIQLACVNGLNNIGRVPYNEAGYTIIRSWMGDTIAQAKVNGVIQTGVTLNQTQKAQLFNEIGLDVSSTIETDGYYLQVSDPGAEVRQNRESPIIGLWFTYGGAVHRLDIPVTLIK